VPPLHTRRSAHTQHGVGKLSASFPRTLKEPRRRGRLLAPPAKSLECEVAVGTVGHVASSGRPRWLNAEQQRIWRTYLLGSARLHERLDADLRDSGLDLPEYEILVVLSESEDRRCRMSDLADAVHQSRSRLTHTIARMERADLVRRVSCPTDRRGVWAQLTDEGMELLETVAPSHVAAVRRNLVDAVDRDDFKALGRVFAAVLKVEGEEPSN
jgi:DNA-binding MarR family transcriptional regulator